MDSKYKSHELNLFSNADAQLKLYDNSSRSDFKTNGWQVFQLDLTKSGETSYSNSHGVYIPQLMLSVNGAVAGVSWLLGDLVTSRDGLVVNAAQEVKDRKAADDLLQAGVNSAVTRMNTADSFHSGNRAEDNLARYNADQAIISTATQEAIDRKSGDGALASSISTNKLASDNEILRAVAEEKRIDDKLTLEIADRKSANSTVSGDVSSEQGRAIGAEATLNGAIETENKRALAAESKLGGRIDFITSNADPASLDSLSEIVTQFSNNGLDYASRLHWLEGVVASLLSKVQEAQ